MTIVIEKEDLKKLKELHTRAQDTPCIKMTSDPKEKDFSQQAWDSVREFGNSLATKYGFEYEKHAINTCTGEVVLI